MSGIFISYRREDSAGWTGRLAEMLTQRFGYQAIFMDIDTVEPGADFTEALQKAISRCDVLLAMIGPEWGTTTDKSGRLRIDDPDDWVRIEIATALKRKVRVVPVLVGGASIPSMDLLPDELDPLAHRQAHELTDKRWHFDVEQLIRTFPYTLRNPWGIPHFQLSPSTPVIIGGLVFTAMVVVWPMFSSFQASLPSPPDSSSIEVQKPPEIESLRKVSTTTAIVSTPPLSVKQDAEGSAAPIAHIETGKPPIALRTGQEARLKDHVTSCAYKVLAAQVERSQSDLYVLRLIVRVTNEGSMTASFGDSNFRLLVDEVLRAPTENLIEIVDARSSKDGTIVFAVPITAKRLILQFYMGDEMATFPL